MKRTLIIIFAVILIVLSAGIFYLNNVFLPLKIKSAIVNTLQEATGKKVTLERLRFSILKGLVLNDLVIQDQGKRIIVLKEASCGFFFPAVFQKKIIIPVINLRQPQVFLERRKDNTFNLQDLFPKKTVSGKSKFSVILYKVKITGAVLAFQDDTFSEPFTKILDGINLNVYLSLPASVKFNISLPKTANNHFTINISGQYRLLQKDFLAKAVLKGILPQEFVKYYEGCGIKINAGTIDASLILKVKDDFLYLDGEVEKKNLALEKENISINLSGRTDFKLNLNLKDKTYKLEGKATILDSSLAGLQAIDSVTKINAEINFNESTLSSSKFSAEALGIPFTATFSLRDFSKPALEAVIVSHLDLALTKGILQEKFKLAIPAQIKGEGSLKLEIKSGPNQEPPQLKGLLDITGASLSAEKFNFIAQDIKGRVEFTRDSLSFAPLNFNYGGIPYKLEATLKDFKYPNVRASLSSAQFLAKTAFSVRDKLMQITEGDLKIYNSQFSFTGSLDITRPEAPAAAINGQAQIDLADTLKFNWGFKDRLQKASPKGAVNARFSLKGALKDLKSCSIQADLSGSRISFYGINVSQLNMDYLQEQGSADIASLHMAMYDGSIDSSVKVDLNSKDHPYRINAVASGIKIEKLKLDTPVKDKDISGTINVDVKLTGLLSDISKLNGAGNIAIKDGKIWNLDLFKGLGSIVFTRDFSSIIFNEGSCSFMVAQKHVFTENLLLKSNITNLSGKLNIGFDGSLEGSLDVQVLSEMVPVSGGFRDLTTAIMGQSGCCGTIKISGTLKEPKYKFKTAVIDILNGIKKSIFGE
ncbi:MAG: AsmA family protein [Candidatus Omnitrophota bacterium]